MRPGYLFGTPNADSVTLEIPGVKNLAIWDNLLVDNRVGIGTTDPKQILHVNGSSEIYSTGSGAGFKFADRAATPWSNHDWVWYSTGDIARFWRSGVGDLIAIKTDGNVGIGTTDPKYKLDVRGGDINVGNTAMVTPKEKLAMANDRVGLDVAEIFQTNDEVEIGDVLVVSKDGRKLEKTVRPYDVRVIGVVSGSPAVVFEGSDLKIGAKPFRFTKGTKPPIALAGRVPVKVSLENGEIKPGDFLTTSSVPGVAMKATEGGATLGIALESYSGGQEYTILVFVNVGERNTVDVIGAFQKQLDEMKRTINSLRQGQDDNRADDSKKSQPLW